MVDLVLPRRDRAKHKPGRSGGCPSIGYPSARGIAAWRQLVCCWKTRPRRPMTSVLAIGPVTTLAATTTLPSPVVGGFLQDAEMIGVMWDELGRSPHEHLALAVARGRVRRDLQAFHRLVPFSRVHAVVDRALAEEIPEFTQRVLEAARSDVFSIVVVAAADAETIGQLKAEALYLGILPWLQGTARSELFEQLADRGIPVFSARGAPDVEAGALAALLPEAEDQLARCLAQHIDGILITVGR